jgi:hypothetical protein
MYSSIEKAIQIPLQHYIGLVHQINALPLGYMIPEGQDSISKKRKEKIDQYCLLNSTRECEKSQISSNTKIIDNKPMLGFKIGKNTKRNSGYGKGEVLWRIEDPRGFELDITSFNLMQILGCVTVENGEILEKCIWGRLASYNVLIPVSSEVFKDGYLRKLLK